jgi:ABC-type transport system involved in multi-copper enzyme maturation permease subunit
VATGWGLLALLAWVVVPLLVAVKVFERQDL